MFCLSLSLCIGGYVSTDYNASYVTGNRAYTNFTCPKDYGTLPNCTYDVVDDCDGDEAVIECVYGKY